MANNEYRGYADQESGVLTSSGEAPTGGVAVGAATDRKQPDRTIRATATGETTHVTGTGTDLLNDEDDE